MRAVILDLKGLEALDLSAIEFLVDELVCYDLTAEDEIAHRIDGFDIVITNKTPLSRHHLEHSAQLKLICVLATGTNVVDKQAAYELGIPVSNCVAYGVDSVVQHVWSLILALHTNLSSYTQDVAAGEWQRSEQFCFLTHPIIELKGRTLGIIGYGHLGQGVAKIAEAFGMKVIVCQKIGDMGHTQKDDNSKRPFDQFIQQADVISLHCPLTEATENLFTTEIFEQMKPEAFIINTARGGIVNEADLADALRRGIIAGAACDVLTEEPPVKGNELLDSTIPNLLITPHTAWGSIEARNRIIEQTAENMRAFMSGTPIRTV